MVEKEKSKLEKVREEIGNEGAYWNEVRGDIDYVKGISFCIDVIDKYLKEESEQEPCRKFIDYDAVMQILYDFDCANENALMVKAIKELPSVNLQEKTGHCKECKYFEYDSVAKVDGIPLIVAHEICSKWGDGCKTKEDGYCFLFEPKESEEHTG